MHLLSAGEVLGEKIRGIHFASNFLDCDCACPDFLLESRRVGLQMPEFAESGPGGNADRRTGVGPRGNGQVQAYVLHERLVPQSSARCLHKAVVLCLFG